MDKDRQEMSECTFKPKLYKPLDIYKFSNRS